MSCSRAGGPPLPCVVMVLLPATDLSCSSQGHSTPIFKAAPLETHHGHAPLLASVLKGQCVLNCLRITAPCLMQKHPSGTEGPYVLLHWGAMQRWVYLLRDARLQCELFCMSCTLLIACNCFHSCFSSVLTLSCARRGLLSTKGKRASGLAHFASCSTL